jgi:hypothetical protein
MNIVLSTTVLASVLAPVFSFGYLDQLGGAPVAVAAPSIPAFVPPVAAAAPAAPYQSSFAEAAGPTTTVGNYLESLNYGDDIRGPGFTTHVDTLNTGTSPLSGAGIRTYANVLPAVNALVGGGGFNTHVDSLSPSDFSSSSFSPYGAASASFSGSASADGVSFTLETGDISGLVKDLGQGGTLRLSGSINSISYN